MNVFTYGSLMFEPVWGRVVRGRYRQAEARLTGFRRHAVHGASYPGLARAPAASCIGRIYFGVSPRDLARLDAFEGPGYRRVPVRCRLLETGAPLAAAVYLFRDARLLEPRDWDPEGFAAGRLTRFVHTHWG